jgi:hypothetical protein
MTNAEINTLTPDRRSSQFCLFGNSLEQFGWVRAKRCCNPYQNQNGRIALSAFYAADIGEVDFRRERQLFLRHIGALAESPYILPNNGAPVVHPMMNGGRAYIL